VFDGLGFALDPSGFVDLGGAVMSGSAERDRAASPAVDQPPGEERPSGRRRPALIIFFSPASGLCRRVDGYLAQILQRRRNHETFKLVRVAVEEHGDLARRFQVEEIPTLVVVEAGSVRARVEGRKGRRAIEAALADWLR
jgi:hypothetical protein